MPHRFVLGLLRPHSARAGSSRSVLHLKLAVAVDDHGRAVVEVGGDDAVRRRDDVGVDDGVIVAHPESGD